MTFAEIVANVLKWTNKPEITQSVPTFITLMEADLNHRLGAAGLASGHGVATLTLSAGAEYVAAPADLARLIQVTRKADSRPIENVTQSSFRSVKACDPNRHDSLAIVTLAGGSLRFYPLPTASTVVEVSYQQSLAALGDATPTNWVSVAYPDAYIYGTLWKAAEFLGDDAAMGRWLPLYERAVDGLVAAERDKAGAQKSPAYRPQLPVSPGLRAGVLDDDC